LKNPTSEANKSLALKTLEMPQKTIVFGHSKMGTCAWVSREAWDWARDFLWDMDLELHAPIALSIIKSWSSLEAGITAFVMGKVKSFGWNHPFSGWKIISPIAHVNSANNKRTLVPFAHRGRLTNGCAHDKQAAATLKCGTTSRGAWSCQPRVSWGLAQS